MVVGAWCGAILMQKMGASISQGAESCLPHFFRVANSLFYYAASAAIHNSPEVIMSFTLTDQHRLRIQETQDFWLATVKPDASAHLVPIWAVLLDDLFYIATAPGSQKVRNMVAHPRVALALPDTLNSVIFEGSATVLSGSPPTGVLERFEKKYDWSFEPDEQWILVQFVPLKVLSW